MSLEKIVLMAVITPALGMGANTSISVELPRAAMSGTADWTRTAFTQEQRSIAYQDLLAWAEAKTVAQEWTEAAASWEKLVEMNPTMPRYWNELGNARLKGKDYRKAIPAFEKALEFGAGYPFNAYNIACCGYPFNAAYNIACC